MMQTITIQQGEQDGKLSGIDKTTPTRMFIQGRG